jgi:hypothetical protein
VKEQKKSQVLSDILTASGTIASWDELAFAATTRILEIKAVQSATATITQDMIVSSNGKPLIDYERLGRDWLRDWYEVQYQYNYAEKKYERSVGMGSGGYRSALGESVFVDSQWGKFTEAQINTLTGLCADASVMLGNSISTDGRGATIHRMALPMVRSAYVAETMLAYNIFNRTVDKRTISVAIFAHEGLDFFVGRIVSLSVGRSLPTSWQGDTRYVVTECTVVPGVVPTCELRLVEYVEPAFLLS